MRELKEWINESDNNKAYFRQQLNDWAAGHQGESALFDKNKAFRRFKSRVFRAEELMATHRPLPETKALSGNRRRLYYKIASCAAVLLLVASGVLYFLQNDGLAPSPTLTAAKAPAYTQINVPPGKRVKYILPDQSIVWLNAGTTFKYPKAFKGKTREVYLNGEGYFQVAKDASHPFIVNTTKGNITVTGTIFDVYSYDAKPRFVTALLEGHVYVNAPDGQIANLLPSQKAELKNGSLDVTAVTEPDAYRWMEGLICFENQPIKEVLENLENAFGQKITVDQLKKPELLLTGKFRVSDGLEYALKVLSDSYEITYKRDTTGKGYRILN